MDAGYADALFKVMLVGIGAIVALIAFIGWVIYRLVN